MFSLSIRYCLYCLALVLSVRSDAGPMAGDRQDTPAGRQTGTPQTVETYRLRVENAEYGRVEVSTDGGAHYLLLGRVSHSAEQQASDAAAAEPSAVARSGEDGIAFTFGPHHVLKLLPQAPPPPHGAPRLPVEACALITDLASHTGPLGALAPPPGTPVRLQVSNDTLDPILPGHPLSNDDLFVFVVSLPPASGASADAWYETVRAQFAELAQRYADGALTRARAAGRKIVSGTLTLKAKMPTGEPDPVAAVTYAENGILLAGQNVEPYSFDWNTRSAVDGEHVIEITAMNREGRLITHIRALVVVNNHPAPAAASQRH